MITRRRRTWPNGGMPPIDEPGQVVGLDGRGPPNVGPAQDGAEPRQVHPVRTRHQADDRLELVLVGLRDEHERLHDLAELHANRPGGIFGGVGGLGEDGHVEGDTLLLGRPR